MNKFLVNRIVATIFMISMGMGVFIVNRYVAFFFFVVFLYSVITGKEIYSFKSISCNEIAKISDYIALLVAVMVLIFAIESLFFT